MIQLINISLSFGAQVIFKELSWHVKEGRKIGLVGPNGVGKTTIMDVIAGIRQPDSGSISMSPSMTIGYLPQEIQKERSERPVLDEAMTAFKEISELEKEAESITEILKAVSDFESQEYKRLISRLDIIHTELTARDAHKIQHQAEKLLTGLGFEPDELLKPINTFSGGWRMRVALAKLLLRNPDLLLLDEPTNHLDIESIDWLETYLKTFPGTVVLVSHDRYFLDRMVDHIAELIQGQVIEYTGNYTSYLQQRESRRAQHESAYENQQRQIRQIERFIERFRYKATKARQVQSRIKMLEKLERIPPPPVEDPSIHFRFPEPEKSGRTVIELSTFSKTYNDKIGNGVVVFKDTGPLVIERGDKIALVGKNGAGKSTLARILLGIEPFEGTRKVGYKTEITYFAQHQAESLNPSNTIIGELEEHSNGKNETMLRSLLGAFLFTGDDVFKRIGVLSGGEKSRVALAKTLISPTNFMILDEPTNHLDIQSRKILIEALSLYTGTFVVVSHDRHFLDRIANKVWYVGHSQVHAFLGNYSDYQYHLNKEVHHFSTDNNGGQKAEINNENLGIETVKSRGRLKGSKRSEAEERNRMYREVLERGIENIKDWKSLSPKQIRKGLAELEERIQKMEERKSEIESLLQNPRFYEEKELSHEIANEYSQLENTLNKLYDGWEAINIYLEVEET
jgi:ATP-binding cassette subfamily F protein 3